MNRAYKTAIFLAATIAFLFLYRTVRTNILLEYTELLNVPIEPIYGYPPAIYLPVFTFVLLVLLIIVTVRKVNTEKALRALSYTRKLSVEEFEQMKAKHTREAVRELTTSEAYRRYLQDKYDGKYGEIALSENDQIDLSDDSSMIHSFH